MLRVKRLDVQIAPQVAIPAKFHLFLPPAMNFPARRAHVEHTIQKVDKSQELFVYHARLASTVIERASHRTLRVKNVLSAAIIQWPELATLMIVFFALQGSTGIQLVWVSVFHVCKVLEMNCMGKNNVNNVCWVATPKK